MCILNGGAVSSGFAVISTCPSHCIELPTFQLRVRKATQEIATQSHAGSTMGPQAYSVMRDPPWGHRCTPTKTSGEPQLGHLRTPQTRYQAYLFHSFHFFFFCVFCIFPYFPLFAFKTRFCYYMAQASFRMLYLLRAGITVRHYHENFVCPVNGYTGRVVWLQKMRWDCDYYIKYSLSHSMYNTGS